MTLFACQLEARLPDRNLARVYRLTASQDLFGAYLHKVCFGRIGAQGRCLRYALDDGVAVPAKRYQLLKHPIVTKHQWRQCLINADTDSLILS